MRQHDQEIYEAIEGMLRDKQWSPEQIANWLMVAAVARISHMTIYRYVREDAKYGGVLRLCLRQGGKRRRKRTFGPEKRGACKGSRRSIPGQRKWRPAWNRATGRKTR